jgi:hypothetical protein
MENKKYMLGRIEGTSRYLYVECNENDKIIRHWEAEGEEENENPDCDMCELTEMLITYFIARRYSMKEGYELVKKCAINLEQYIGTENNKNGL